MKKLFSIVFVLAGLAPFVSPACGAPLNTAYDRYLEKRDMNFGQRRESEKKAEEKTQEVEIESEAPKSQVQELAGEIYQTTDDYDDAFEKAYAARQEVL